MNAGLMDYDDSYTGYDYYNETDYDTTDYEPIGRGKGNKKNKKNKQATTVLPDTTLFTTTTTTTTTT